MESDNPNIWDPEFLKPSTDESDISPPTTHPRTNLKLPLYGFYSGQERQHPGSWEDGKFLYRVWRGPEQGRRTITYSEQDGFVAHAFATLLWEMGSHNFRKHITESTLNSNKNLWSPFAFSHHVHDGSPWNTPYISTTLSLFWALVFAHRIQDAPAHQIYISVIRISALDPRAISHALRHMDGRTSSWAYAAADQSQEVLVYGQIPAESVIAHVNFEELLEDLSISAHWIDMELDPQPERGRDFAVAWAWKLRDSLNLRLGSVPTIRKAQRDLLLNDHARSSVQVAMTILGLKGAGFKVQEEVKTDVIDQAVYIFRWPFRGSKDRWDDLNESDLMPGVEESRQRVVKSWNDPAGYAMRDPMLSSH